MEYFWYIVASALAGIGTGLVGLSEATVMVLGVYRKMVYFNIHKKVVCDLEQSGFTEQDWQLFKKRIPKWQEAYMDKLNKEYIAILEGGERPSEKFWSLEKRIKEDKHRAGVRLELTRAAMMGNIVRLINEGAISMDDLDEFSEELKERTLILAGKM